MRAAPNFIVVDTEGTTVLKEISVIDRQGRIIQQALVKEHSDHVWQQVNIKSQTAAPSNPEPAPDRLLAAAGQTAEWRSLL